MWTEEMKEWLSLSHHIDYLSQDYEMADTMGFIDKWRKNWNETKAKQDLLWESFTDEQKRIVTEL